MITSSSTHHVAIRKQGVCRGTLWRQELSTYQSTQSSGRNSRADDSNNNQSNSFRRNSSSNHPASSINAAASFSSMSMWGSTISGGGELEYCTVAANWFWCHESFAAYERGDAPLHLYRVVGATENSTSNNTKYGTHSFQLVTDQGTQVLCQALTEKCRDHWLATLHAGLELTLLSDDNNAAANLSSFAPASSAAVSKMTPPAPQVNTLPTPSTYRAPFESTITFKKPPKYCVSCGALETPQKTLDPQQHACPLSQYGIEFATLLCKDCSISQGLLQHLQLTASCMASALQEHLALLEARKLCVSVVTPSPNSPNQRITTLLASSKNKERNDGNKADDRVGNAKIDQIRDDPSTPPSLGKRTSLEPQSPPPAAAPPPPPAAASSGGSSSDGDKNSDSSNESWTNVDKPIVEDVVTTKPNVDGEAKVSTETTSQLSAAFPAAASPITLSTPPSSVASNFNTTWIHISPNSKSTANLLKVVRDKKCFGALTRVSPFLEQLAQDLMEGRIGVADFLEQLDDAVGQGETAELTSALKKQAFRVAGDMGTAMKLLLDHALPHRKSTDAVGGAVASFETESSYDEQYTHIQTLQCLLEFFLDLCQDGELSSIAFFWPQLCHLHLCMLPADNAFAVARVDLVEDFLLTVATQYSVQLALELVWSHTADLEESLGNTLCSSVCRARRFSVLRFVCELESYLFGHEDGWGGGSVTLGKMLSATGDQLLLLKRTISQIQNYRGRALCQLQHSVRKQFYEAQHSSSSCSGDPLKKTPEEQVQEKLRIAKNADYFTSHLNFTKRVCDIAEKLRFMEAKKRAGTLEEELNLLNSSGAMGGDPLNHIRPSVETGDHIRIVRVPIREGHVFRSKERTPVLLLVEQVDEGAESAYVDNDEGEYQTPNSKFNEIVKESRTHIRDLDEDDNDEPEGSEAIKPQESEGIADDDDASSANTPNPMNDSCQSSSRRSLNSPSFLEGAPEDHRQHTHALKRFDGSFSSSNAPSTPKEIVDQIVTNVMVEQVKHLDQDLDLPALTPVTTTEGTNTEAAAEAVKFVVDESPVDGTAPSSPDMESAPKEVSFGAEVSTSPKTMTQRRMFKNSTCEMGDHPNELAPTGDIRREVLNVIMMRGREGRNSIAAGTADLAQRSLKELETKRAMELLDETETAAQLSHEKDFEDLKSTSDKMTSLGLSGSSGKGWGDDAEKPSEEDEVMEAVRLLLIQNRVAQGHLSAADAAKVLQHVSLSRVSSESDLYKKDGGAFPVDMPTIDAGDLDPRLAGCGPLPPAVLQALTLWKGEMVTNGELLELVKKDIAFVRHSVLLEAENVDKLKEDSAFWGRFAFGERWAEKKSRIAASSPQGSHPGWDLVGIIVKSNDDLRQEAFIMQLIELCQEAFEIAGLELWVSPYRILATGRTTGIIEMVRNAMSFDALKKRPGYGKGGLREHLQRMTEFTADPGGSFKTAQQNFVRSLAAYSLMSYFFLFKDRHNGNLLLDTAGHVIHIDFGFVFGVAPGGSFSLEMSTPFKLTEEMLEVMGGLNSPLFSDFVTLFCCGFLALQSYSDTFFTLVEITSHNSTFKCFESQNREEILARLHERFCPDLNKEETVAFALDLIKQATTSYGTRQYDLFQYLSQGVAA